MDRTKLEQIIRETLKEEAPPGREHQVKGLKKHIGKDIPKTYIDKKTGERKESNPWALAWAQQNKHGKPASEGVDLKEVIKNVIREVLAKELLEKK